MSSSVLFSFSISDDDLEEPIGKMKVESRLKRKKLFLRSNRGFLDRTFRLLARWWPLLIFILAIILLAFEASKLGKVDKRQLEGSEVQRTNLSRLDPTARVVNGIREVCLKMLKQEELNKLEFPENTIYSSPVKSVIYKTDLGQYPVEGNTTMLRHQNGTARFNLFTGYQTLEDREESFNVKDNAEVHCGFYSDIGGFKISDEDRLYMKNCKAVVSTCAFGGGDDLYQPIGMSEASLYKVCFVAFWDELTRAAQEAFWDIFCVMMTRFGSTK